MQRYLFPLSKEICISSSFTHTKLTMKESYTRLYPNEQVAAAVGDYAFNHSTALPPHITGYHELGSAHEKSIYMISPFQAQF